MFLLDFSSSFFLSFIFFSLSISLFILSQFFAEPTLGPEEGDWRGGVFVLSVEKTVAQSSDFLITTLQNGSTYERLVQTNYRFGKAIDVNGDNLIIGAWHISYDEAPGEGYLYKIEEDAVTFGGRLISNKRQRPVAALADEVAVSKDFVLLNSRAGVLGYRIPPRDLNTCAGNCGGMALGGCSCNTSCEIVSLLCLFFFFFYFALPWS